MTEEPAVFVIASAREEQDSLPEMLRSAGLTCRRYGSVEQFLHDCPTTSSGCLVCDGRMPQLDVVQLAEQLARREAAVSLILVTGPADVALTVQAMERGVMTALASPVDGEELAAAVRQGLELAAAWRARQQRWQQFDRRLARLSRGQRNLLELLVAGNSSQQVALQIGKSVRTVDRHRRVLLQKMGAETVVGLALEYACWQRGRSAGRRRPGHAMRRARGLRNGDRG